ncbi:5'-3' exoribonculease [Planoprotostelium fungivorum]|uniref:5'-3' exoribonculease n=1 Tax=Planoprotostelium fungivorum TaxID=1890364 RepID=A0A2P6N8H2_9EUKA|nr:5'-3' exoribonculease [Planoprotostelium fungivorum]
MGNLKSDNPAVIEMCSKRLCFPTQGGERNHILGRVPGVESPGLHGGVFHFFVRTFVTEKRSSMGIPGFYRWVTSQFPDAAVKLPSLDANIAADPYNTSEHCCDYLYLDMNGIIHNSTYQTDNVLPPSYEAAGARVWEYMDKLVSSCQPSRCLYIALDGVAPRAKMNQQRQRRYTASKQTKDEHQTEARLKKTYLKNNQSSSEGRSDDGALKDYVDEAKKSPFYQFDSNQITPGTPFMEIVSAWVHQYAIQHTQQPQGFWNNVDIIVSDSSISSVPGEGEHKLVDFVRQNQKRDSEEGAAIRRHVFYGPDADLMMLGMAVHQNNFWVLRENTIAEPCPLCGRSGHSFQNCKGSQKQKKRDDHDHPSNTTVHLFNIPKNTNERDLRDYFGTCGDIKEVRLIHDHNTFQTKNYCFVEFQTHEAAVAAVQLNTRLFKNHILHVRFAKMSTEEKFEINDDKLAQFQSVTGMDSETSTAFLLEAKGDLQLAIMNFFDPSAGAEEAVVQSQLLKIAGVIIMSFSSLTPTDMEMKENEGREEDKSSGKSTRLQLIDIDKLMLHIKERMVPDGSAEPSGGFEITDNFLLLAVLGGNDFLPPIEMVSIKEGDLNWLVSNHKNWYSTSSGGLIDGEGAVLWNRFASYIETLLDKEHHKMAYKYRKVKIPKGEPNRKATQEAVVNDLTNTMREGEEIEEKKENEKEEEKQVEDPYQHWRDNYYRSVFGVVAEKPDFITELVAAYVETVQWVVLYYRKGIPSWSWYYPYHFPPLLYDIHAYLSSHGDLTTSCRVDLQERLGAPFLPFQQLMAVLPPNSIRLALPPSFHSLIEEGSSVGEFYPSQWKTIHRGAYRKFSVADLPFIEEKRFLSAVRPVEEGLSSEEAARNRNVSVHAVYSPQKK